MIMEMMGMRPWAEDADKEDRINIIKESRVISAINSGLALSCLYERLV